MRLVCIQLVTPPCIIRRCSVTDTRLQRKSQLFVRLILDSQELVTIKVSVIVMSTFGLIGTQVCGTV